MRTRTAVVAMPNAHSHWFSDRAPLSRCDAWRNRALRDISLVRRIVRGAPAGLTALGQVETLLALEDGAARLVLLTHRFIERRPTATVAMQRLAKARRVHIAVLSGAAAFELDMAGDGVGALPYRMAATPPEPLS